ncbi:MAG: hypothetical protein PVJ67_00310 [Candidatus Pacearchaeota archaeon]|jgi:hypothetical protein
MKIGIIGPTSFSSPEEINKDAKRIVSEISKKVSECEIVLTPDKGSVSEFFAKSYIENKGKKVYSIIPLDDKEFGFDWVNQEIGKNINCKTWRNQPERLNEETDLLICLGYAEGVLVEIAYSKWFRPKIVYIIKELVSGELPKDAVRKINLKYISYEELEEELK